MSSLTIVTVAEAVVTAAPAAPLSCTVKASLGSNTRSPITEIRSVLALSPGAKVTKPLAAV